MTTVYKLTDGTDTIDFTGDVGRVAGTFVYQGRQDNRVTEVFDVRVKGASTGAVRTNAQGLADLLMLAREWVDDTLRSNSVYLVWQTTGETEKRALVFDFELEPSEDNILTAHDIDGLKASWRLAITRSYWWEASLGIQDTSSTNIDTLGGKFNPSGTLSGGDFNARINSLRLTTDATAGDQTQVWLGLRPLRGGVSSFDPVHECEDNLTTLEADTASAADAGASGGNAVECDFSATTDMAFRFYSTVPTEAAGTPILHGQYHVLLRAKVDTGTVAARLAASYTSPSFSTPHTRGPIVYVTDTAYTLYDMGSFALPYSILRDQIPFSSDILLSIMAEEVDGTPTLSCDTFVLVPAEHSLYLENVESLGSGNRLDILATEDDRVVAAVQISGGGLTFPAVSDTGVYDWSYPREGGVFVVASQRSGGHDLTDQYSDQQMTVSYRWLTYHV